MPVSGRRFVVWDREFSVFGRNFNGLLAVLFRASTYGLNLHPVNVEVFSAIRIKEKHHAIVSTTRIVLTWNVKLMAEWRERWAHRRAAKRNWIIGEAR